MTEFAVDFDVEKELQRQWVMQLRRILRRHDVDFRFAESIFQYHIRPFIIDLADALKALDIEEKYKNDEKLMYEFIGRYIDKITF